MLLRLLLAVIGSGTLLLLGEHGGWYSKHLTHFLL